MMSSTAANLFDAISIERVSFGDTERQHGVLVASGKATMFVGLEISLLHEAAFALAAEVGVLDSEKAVASALQQLVVIPQLVVRSEAPVLFKNLGSRVQEAMTRCPRSGSGSANAADEEYLDDLSAAARAEALLGATARVALGPRRACSGVVLLAPAEVELLANARQVDELNRGGVADAVRTLATGCSANIRLGDPASMTVATAFPATPLAAGYAATSTTFRSSGGGGGSTSITAEQPQLSTTYLAATAAYARLPSAMQAELALEITVPQLPECDESCFLTFYLARRADTAATAGADGPRQQSRTQSQICIGELVRPIRILRPLAVASEKVLPVPHAGAHGVFPVVVCMDSSAATSVGTGSITASLAPAAHAHGMAFVTLEYPMALGLRQDEAVTVLRVDIDEPTLHCGDPSQDDFPTNAAAESFTADSPSHAASKSNPRGGAFSPQGAAWQQQQQQQQTGAGIGEGGVSGSDCPDPWFVRVPDDTGGCGEGMDHHTGPTSANSVGGGPLKPTYGGGASADVSWQAGLSHHASPLAPPPPPPRPVLHSRLLRGGDAGLVLPLTIHPAESVCAAFHLRLDAPLGVAVPSYWGHLAELAVRCTVAYRVDGLWNGTLVAVVELPLAEVVAQTHHRQQRSSRPETQGSRGGPPNGRHSSRLSSSGSFR